MNRLMLVLTTGVKNIEIRKETNQEGKDDDATVQSQSKQLVGFKKKWGYVDASSQIYK